MRQWGQLFRQAHALVGRERPWRWGLLVVLALVVTALEAIGALLIFALMGLISAPDSAIEFPVLGDLATLFPGVDRRTLLLAVSGLVAGFFVVRALVVIGQAYVQNRVVQNAGAVLATRLVRGYMELPYLFHTQQNSAVLVRNTFDSVRALATSVLKPLVELLAQLMLVVGLLGVLVFASPTATLLAIGTLGPMMWLLLRIVQPRLKALGRTAQDRKSGSLEALQQALGGVRDIRLLRRESYFTQVFARERRQLARAEYVRGAMSELPRALIETTLVLVIVLVFVLAIISGDRLDTIVSTLGLFAYASLRLQPSLRLIISSLNSLKFGAAVIDDLFEDVTRSDAALRQASQRRSVLDDATPFRESIQFCNVSFSYIEGGMEALRDVDLTIRKGEFVGFCGPTGGGKSTLVDLLVGLLEPTSGCIEVDGRLLADDARWWYGKLGVVSQSVFLIDDTLRRNIAFGLGNSEIDEDRLQRSIARAQLDDVVKGLAEGTETIVGERGIRLSGGQRQRVSIARALYHEPEIIVFDEGTSALDTATESALVAAIDLLKGDRTLITVAHRVSTLRRADRIMVVEHGRIAASGSHDELLERSKLFRSLAS